MSQREPDLDRELPPELSERFAIVGMVPAPTTLGEWVESTRRVLESADLPTGLEAMCTTDRDRHEATVVGETRYFHCVLDTLLLPFVVDEDDPIDVRSRGPLSGDQIDVAVSREEVVVSPETAVMSFGFAAELDRPTGEPIDASVGYDAFCPYVNAFADRNEYERWAEGTEEAVTIGLTFDEGHALARALEGAPIVGSDSL